MINLEQVKLLEKKVAKAVDYVERLAKENAALSQRETELHTKLESYQKRIDELEILVMGFKEDQGRIEEGILAALDRLNQFEKAMEKSLKDKGSKIAKKPVVEKSNGGSGDGQTCFEIPRDEVAGETGSASQDDIPDPLKNTANADAALSSVDGAEAGELDIF